MATVYLAEDLKHHRNVAIKVLRPELAAQTLNWLDRYLGPVRWGRGGVLEAYPVEAGPQPASP